MHKLEMRPMGRRIVAGLRRNHDDVPDEVLIKEARFRFCTKALELNEGGTTQESIAAKFGYTVNHLQRSIIRIARQHRDQRNVLPLDACRSFVSARASGDLDPAPAPDAAFTPEAMSTAYAIDPVRVSRRRSGTIRQANDSRKAGTARP